MGVTRLRDRKHDTLIVRFFVTNLLFRTSVVDLDQRVVTNPYHYTPPIWSPELAVKIIHAYGQDSDPHSMVRSVWWKATIRIDAIFFGPFYAVAICAFTKGKLDSSTFGDLLLCHDDERRDHCE
jgi:hypothetical protein